jgi:hypothetical protein
LSRVINPETAGKERVQFQRAIILAIRELMKQSTVDSSTYDLTAFIVLTLFAIDRTIDASVAAWEKRGYWIKADRYRQEWCWAIRLAIQMKDALVAGSWMDVAMIASKVADKLKGVKVPIRHGLGTPWVGAWEELSKSQ